MTQSKVPRERDIRGAEDGLGMDRSVRDLESLMSPQKDAKYLAYEDKFKKKYTTDDSFTPDEVYEAIRRWVLTEYGISDDRPIIRPFYPGGDYERERYPDNALVLDNPPFSILMQIVKFYCTNGISFFLFADARTVGWYLFVEGCSIVLPDATVRYANGASIPTAFVTNLMSDCRIRVSSSLHDAIAEAQPSTARRLPRYDWPANIVTPMRLARGALYGQEYGIKRCVPVKRLDDGHEIFGGGALISDADAELIASQMTRSEPKKVPVRLSQREMDIIASLGMERQR